MKKTVWNINLELVEADCRALHWLRRRHFNKHANIAHVAHWIMLLAIQRPKVVGAWLECLAHYCNAEDICQREFLLRSVAAVPQYRRAILPQARSGGRGVARKR